MSHPPTPPASTVCQQLRIAVVPKGTTHEFWKAVHAGAAKAARELSVEIIWKGPLKEDDLKAQIDVVQSFVAQGVAGIVLAPLNDKGLVGAVQQAQRQEQDRREHAAAVTAEGREDARLDPSRGAGTAVE